MAMVMLENNNMPFPEIIAVEETDSPALRAVKAVIIKMLSYEATDRPKMVQVKEILYNIQEDETILCKLFKSSLIYFQVTEAVYHY